MELVDYVINEARGIGFGGAFSMIFISPFILFFSFTKRYKKSLVDIMIPVVAVVVVALVGIEVGRLILMLMPEKISTLLGMS